MRLACLGVEVLHGRHVLQQCPGQGEELVLLDVDCRDLLRPTEVEGVLVQALQLALLDVAGRITWNGVFNVGALHEACLFESGPEGTGRAEEGRRYTGVEAHLR